MRKCLMWKQGLIRFRFPWRTLLAVGVSVVLTANAAELRVDFNASGRPLSETWDTSYTPWSTNQSWFPSGANSISNTFDGVTYTFRRVGPTGTELTTDRYSAGLTTPGWTAKLV